MYLYKMIFYLQGILSLFFLLCQIFFINLLFLLWKLGRYVSFMRIIIKGESVID